MKVKQVSVESVLHEVRDISTFPVKVVIAIVMYLLSDTDLNFRSSCVLV